MTKTKIGLWDVMTLDSRSFQKLPDIREHDNFTGILYFSLLGLRINGGRPNQFVNRDGRLYGTVQGNSYGERASLWNQVKDNIKTANRKGFSMDMTLTNHFIPDEDLEDIAFREFLDFLASQNQEEGVENGITYLNDKLRDFVKQHYGNVFPLTASCLKFSAQPELTYEEIFARGDSVVLTHLDLENHDLLIGLPREKRQDTYILIGSQCKMSCTKERVNAHALQMSRWNMGEKYTVEEIICQNHEGQPPKMYKELYVTLVKAGFSTKHPRLGYPDLFMYVGEKALDMAEYTNFIVDRTLSAMRTEIKS